jgi:serine/threonine-protein kinase
MTPGAAVPFSPSLRPNTRLRNGEFVIGKVLGQGGFGITYKGADTQLRRYVAIKEFFPAGAGRQTATVQAPPGTAAADYEQARQGFVREAMTLARFNHPGIVRVFTVFEENNTAYMVMEFLEGQSLQKLLETRGALPEAEAVRLVTQVAQALDTLHNARLLHRDVKPDNIILTGESPADRAVLIDFGTAREFAGGLTKTMTALVTPGYAPVEQYGRQAKFGPYTDVYALGATLYHCLTGQLPVSAMDRLSGVALAPPAQVNPYVSRAVSDATMRALEVKAPARPQSIADFLHALNTPSSSAPPLSTPAPGVVPSAPTPPAPTVVAPNMAATPWVTPMPVTATPPTQVVAPPNSAVPAPSAPAFDRQCPHCGALAPYAATACPRCGKPLGAPPARSPQGWPSSAPPAGGRDLTSGLGLGAGLGIAGAIVLMLGGAYWYGVNWSRQLIPGGDSPQTTPTSQPLNTAPQSPRYVPPSRPVAPVHPSASGGAINVQPPVAPPPPSSATTDRYISYSDAYDQACEIMRQKLKRPDTAEFLSYYDSHCDVNKLGTDIWRISSAGSATDDDGRTLYFAWQGTVTYSRITDSWDGVVYITHTEY